MILGMIVRNVKVDVNVIVFIGERGREVLDFIDKDLGEEGMKKFVVVYVILDKVFLVRLKGVFIVIVIVEYFRD